MSKTTRDRREFLKAAGVAGVGTATLLGAASPGKAACAPAVGANDDGYYNVVDYGACVDGSNGLATRDAFQDALDDAAQYGGGTVLVPPGSYHIDTSVEGSLDVHEGCGLVGVGGEIIRGLGGSNPTYRGPLLKVTDTNSQHPLLNVFRGARVSNLSFLWPNQNLDTTTAYPAVISGATGAGGDGFDDNERVSTRIDNLFFYNAWRVFDFGDCSVDCDIDPEGCEIVPDGEIGTVVISNIRGFVYSSFLCALGAGSEPTFDGGPTISISNVLLTVGFHPDHDHTPGVPPRSAEKYAQDNCVLIKTNRSHGLKVHAFQAYRCNTFLELVGKDVLDLGEFSNVSLDAVPRIIRSVGDSRATNTNPRTGVNNCVFSNCTFRCTADATDNGAADALELTYERDPVTAGERHNLTFMVCVFRGAMRRFLHIEANPTAVASGLEYLRFIGCHFTEWGATEDTSALLGGTNIAALDVDDPDLNIEVQDCTFLGIDSDLQDPHKMQGVRVAEYKTAKISGCSFYNCDKPIVVFDGGKLMVTQNITNETTSAFSLALGSSGPSEYLIADNLFDKVSALNGQHP
ncbi:MAG: hypothetical protein MPN21_21500 [Thermoanaerobaculia bacterium]|nr:hypothetical protein [Thermoanaerobaculia bacterium]